MSKVLAFSGGVGGAKLVSGLASVLPAQDLAVAVNTGDDFSHLGLTICPDIDSVLYALSGMNDPVRGWGVVDETWSFMEQLKRLGGETWFQLGDRDLALHVERTRLLAEGMTLSQVTAVLAARMGIACAVWPMTDDPVSTQVHTAAGTLAFQQYFVREQCQPKVAGFDFAGAATAQLLPALLESLANPGLEAVVICPSNPFVSIGPMLALPGVREALRDSPAPVIAVSPIVGGQALKGPAAKMMAELSLPVSAPAVADYYGELLDGFVIDRCDESLASAITAVPVCVTQTVMKTADDRRQLAEDVLAFAGSLR